MLKVDASTGEIFIYDVIGQDWFGEGITALNVIEALAQIKGKRAKIRINSPGGDMNEGVGIYNALKRHPGGVDTFNDSLAASAASVIFLAGENRQISKGARVMIHRAWSRLMGNSIDFAKVSAVLDTHDKSQVEIYAEHMGLEPTAIMDLLTAETWYTSEEAVTAKLATSLDVKKADKPKAMAMSFAQSWFKNAPSGFLSQLDHKPNTNQDDAPKQNRFDADIATARRKLIAK